MTATSDLPADGYRLPNISSKAFEHPADRAATAALGSIPMLETVIKRLIEFGYERAIRQSTLSASLKVGPDQLPELHQRWVRVCTVLDIEDRPDLYVGMSPLPNAMAMGAKKPIVVVSSEAAQILDDDELEMVLAHEAGHILSGHVMYQTALAILLDLGMRALPIFAGLPLLGIRYALLEWYRAAEYSCDRCATIVTRDPLLTSRTLMAISAGLPSERLNLDAFLRQAQDYREGGDGFDRIRKLMTELGQTHSPPVKRAHEIHKWVQSGDYNRIIGGEYVKRGEEPPVREETAAATEHYTERFRQLMVDASGQVQSTGEKLAEWLRKE
ncbi:MAG: M48 family metallopeptidase [Solirubrobacteraceae bacterium]|nr:M48 family metallopeptidase [Solirubrobacteraceae bacterium]